MADINNNTLTSDEKETMLKILSSLIAIPSVKGEPTSDAPYGKETLEALQYMLSLGLENGFSVKDLDGRAGYIEWGTGKKMLGLLCHLDVVPAGEGWQSDPFTLRRENGWLIGRGINDDKGPAVTLLLAMIRLKKAGFKPKCRIRLILGLDEECGSSCMEHYKTVEELPTCGFTPDADFPAIFAEKGILQLRLTAPVSTHIRAYAGERPNMVPARCLIISNDTGIETEGLGIPAHASKPELGINAIYEALLKTDDALIAAEPLLSFFMKYIRNDTAGQLIFTAVPEDVSGALTLNAGVLSMDEKRAELVIDIRYPVLSNPDSLMSDIREKAAEFDLRVEISSHQKPLFKDPNEPLIQTLLRVYEKYAGLAPIGDDTPLVIRESVITNPAAPISIGGGTYARSMPGLIAFGPAFPWEKDQAHQIDESMNEETMYLLVQLYQDAIVELSKTMEA